jgi:hypothetical protein
MGAGRSNLNRIALLKPDILKIDKALVRDISKDFHQQEVFKSLVGVAREMGALIIAQGVESEEEAVTILEMGVDLMQGFYFSKPLPVEQFKPQEVESKLQPLSVRFRERILEKNKIKNLDLEKYQLMAAEIAKTLSQVPSENFEQKSLEMISHFPSAEYLFILDEKGRQVSGAIFGPSEEFSKKRLILRPPPMGSDHQFRDYYSRLKESGDSNLTFTGEPHVSPSTGHFCATFARSFKDVHGKNHILSLVLHLDTLKSAPGLS